MRMLVLGGTHFVGLHVVRAALAAGHEVDVFHRGTTPAPEGARSLQGDRDGDLSALESASWDAVVDVSAYLPRQVREAATRLNGRAGRYVFISTASVYADMQPETAEDAPLREPSPFAFRGAAPLSLERAHALGLTHYGVADTVRDALAWDDVVGTPSAGLSDDEEAALLAAWQAEEA